MRLNEWITMVGSGALGLSNPYDCHVYLIGEGDELALIDAGAGLEPERILTNISRWGCRAENIKFLFLTHAHADHAGGAAALAKAIGCTIIGSPAEIALLAHGTDEELGLEAARRNRTYPPDYVYPHTVGVATAAGTIFELGGCRVELLEVPGHSIGSACYLVERTGQRALFSGDVVFHGGFVSVINAYGSDPATYRASLPRLGGLKIDALFPGHGLWALQEGQRHIDLALERMRRSVIPNLAIAWLPPMPLHFW